MLHTILTPFKNATYTNIFQPTRFRDGDEPSFLDLILTNEEGMIYNLTHNAGLGESHHTCINFTFNCYHQVKNTEKVSNYFKANYAIIKQRPSLSKWTYVVNGDFIATYINFIKVLESALDGCVPDYKFQLKKKNIYLTLEAICKKNLKKALAMIY